MDEKWNIRTRFAVDYVPGTRNFELPVNVITPELVKEIIGALDPDPEKVRLFSIEIKNQI